jgi:hypothetical protein
MKKYRGMMVGIVCCCWAWINAGQTVYGQKGKRTVYVPVVEGAWWNITTQPDLGACTAAGQQPVDFAVWQAADGSWQLWSCIRGTRAGGHTRLFYRWEARRLTDTSWTPMGIAMEADTTLGEAKSGLQAPFVLKEKGRYYLFYGDWNRICLAESTDGKNFKRVLHNGSPALFAGPLYNTRDPMVLKTGHTYYCYYTGHLEKKQPGSQPKAAVFCRTSRNLFHWSAPVMVSAGGSAAGQSDWYGGDAECPFVVRVHNAYILFRNQRYGKQGLNTQYCSHNPLDFGVNTDSCRVGQLPLSAPEIICLHKRYYIVALKPGLDGMRMARLKFIRKTF